MTSHNNSARAFFNILIDPWLAGTQTDGTPLVSKQWHRDPPACGSIAEVVALIKREQSKDGSRQLIEDVQTDGLGYIDAVFVSHEFTDHMHQSTLLQLNPEIPVYATPVSFLAKFPLRKSLTYDL